MKTTPFVKAQGQLPVATASAAIDLDPQTSHFVDIPLLRADGSLGNLAIRCGDDSRRPIAVSLEVELFDPCGDPAPPITWVRYNGSEKIPTGSFALKLQPFVEQRIEMSFTVYAADGIIGAILPLHGILIMAATSTEPLSIIIHATVLESDRVVKSDALTVEEIEWKRQEGAAEGLLG